jgi:dihydrolipoamide dehydrogenase
MNLMGGIEQMNEQEYDVIVLGAGPVGQSVAARARAGGLSVAVVERELVGGECSYWGCIPSKALLRPVLAVADARHVDGAREAVTGSLDTAKVFGRRDRYVSNWDDSGQATWVKNIGAELFRGHARLVGPRRVAIETPGRCRRSHRPPCGGHLHRQHCGTARHPRHREGGSLDKPQSD